MQLVELRESPTHMRCGLSSSNTPVDHAYVAADVPADPCLPLRVSRSVTRLARDEPSGIDEGDEGVKAGGRVGETENRKQKTQGGC